METLQVILEAFSETNDLVVAGLIGLAALAIISIFQMIKLVIRSYFEDAAKMIGVAGLIKSAILRIKFWLKK